MVKTGPASKVEDVQAEILKLLINKKEATINGLGFREIFRALKDKDLDKRPGSFSTLMKVLNELKSNNAIIKDSETRKYHAQTGGFGILDKISTRKIISKANVYGGGRLCHPDVQIVDGGFLIPVEGIKPFLINDVFMVADLKESTSKGILNIIIPDPFVTSKDLQRLTPNKPSHETNKTAEILPVQEIIFQRLDLKSALYRWLREIFNLARTMRLISQDCPTDASDFLDEELDKIWEELFNGVETILFTEALRPQQLLEWLKSPKGKIQFKKFFENEKR